MKKKRVIAGKTSARIKKTKNRRAFQFDAGGPTPPLGGCQPPASNAPTNFPAENQPVNSRRINSRRKGAVGEREFAEYLRLMGYPDARRGQQRSGLDQSDVIGGPAAVHFEVKRVEALNVWNAAEQARRDAPFGDAPVVAMRRNGDDGWLAVLPMPVLLHLLKLREQLHRDASALLRGVDADEWREAIRGSGTYPAIAIAAAHATKPAAAPSPPPAPPGPTTTRSTPGGRVRVRATPARPAVPIAPEPEPNPWE